MRRAACVLIASFHFAAYAQSFFNKEIGGKLDDEAVTVRACGDGGYYITGNTKSYGNGGSDVYLVKIDAGGKTVWDRTFGGPKDDFGWGLRVLKNGDVVIVGFSDSQGNGKDDLLVIRTDSKGNQKWLKTYGGPFDDRGWDVMETSDNAIVVVGEYAKADLKTNLDGWLLKLDGEGSVIWSNTYGWDKIDRCFSGVETKDKGFVLSGFTNSTGAGDYDVYLIKADVSGKEQWHRLLAAQNLMLVTTVRLMGEAGYMICGYTRGINTNGKGDAYLIQTDLEGNKLREKSFGDDVEERTLTFVESAKGGYALLGYKEITEQNWDAYLVEVDKELNMLQSKTIGGKFLDTGGHNILRVGDEYVFCGYINETGLNKNIYIIRTNLVGKD